jgi:hypothetical protein
LIVYDKEFNKMFEEAFDHDEYRIGFSKLIPEGLMIRKYDKKQDEKNKRNKEKIYTFDVFNFDF